VADRKPNVLALCRHYPNRLLEHQGLWVQRQMHALAREGCGVTVLAPHPYWPPIPGPSDFTRLRALERRTREGSLEVFHPRFVTGPGFTTYVLEGASTYAAVRRLAGRLHSIRPFDLIHAHFSFPDGTAAVLLGRALGIPVVVTEHVLWRPWMEADGLVRRQAAWTLRHAAARVVVSRAVQSTVESVLGDCPPMHVIPVGVDGDVFTLKSKRPEDGEERLLFVGWVNYVKGMDVLIESLTEVVRRRPRVRLTIVGGALFRHKRQQQDELLQAIVKKGLATYVTYVGPHDAAGVAEFMRDSNALVLPSRRESCGSVLLEALASGTPVVATRCGGPEEIVTDDVGILVPPENPSALADALCAVLERPYDPSRLRSYALSSYSWDHLAKAYLNVYRSVL
jgi:glycosyltransferase involved in cell wall biosynthesis